MLPTFNRIFTRRAIVLLALVLISLLGIQVLMDPIQSGNIQRQILDMQSHYEGLIQNILHPTTENPEEKLLHELLDHNDNSKTCQPVTKIAFAKTHKTGSSTLQNILFRFGEEHGLNFALPKNSWMHSLKESFKAIWVESLPWAGVGYDIFCFHSVWNYNEVKKVLPTAKFITILRDPVQAFESNYVYMGLEKAFKMNINEFAESKAKQGTLRRPKAIIGKNQLLFDLGMNGIAMEHEDAVSKKIQMLDKEMDLVLISEYFDESLILMQDLLCWPLNDLTYLRQNERKKESISDITPEARRILKDWLWADYMLYDHFLAKLKSKVQAIGTEVINTRVEKLSALNSLVDTECVLAKADAKKLSSEFKPALGIVTGYEMNPNKTWCAGYARTEMRYSVLVRDAQIRRASIKELVGDDENLIVPQKSDEEEEKKVL